MCLDLIRLFLCSIICNQLWKANFQVLNAVFFFSLHSVPIRFSSEKKREWEWRMKERAREKKNDFICPCSFWAKRTSEREPIREAWLITIWCIECISNMLNCCDNSNWSMSENQQMSNLIESRHRNEIEQKNKIEKKKNDEEKRNQTN